ncbi:60S ribosomal protein L10a [Camellia lanceoleosa]|uniref:60S ribosomal protein L10a n=1 Tax=Camellia lanceoleosa TaxID=1840588 RepID=A0ACC0FK90_9ERIC|nr:60S ribosomal protein L10a [Camellia lanceoleosa]
MLDKIISKGGKFPTLVTHQEPVKSKVNETKATVKFQLKKKDSDAVKEALDQLSEVGWANKWSSQPYVSRRMTSLRELTTLGIKNAENLAIPSVRNEVQWFQESRQADGREQQVATYYQHLKHVHRRLAPR